MSVGAFNLPMRRTPVEIAAGRTATAVRRRLVEDLARGREDAGLSIAALARAAGVPNAYAWRIFNGDERPSIETYARLSSALGADLSARCYPTTGPTIWDRHQARIEEGLLRELASRWRPLSEVGVRHPVRGWIYLAPARAQGAAGPGDGDRIGAQPPRAADPVVDGQGGGAPLLAGLTPTRGSAHLPAADPALDPADTRDRGGVPAAAVGGVPRSPG
jgi:transcriptional regulator with XRE-family HTH domain